MFGFGKKASVKGLKIAILSTDGVEHAELTEPWRALKKAGADVYVIGSKLGTLETMRKVMRGDKVPIDATVDEVRVDAFDGLLLPGGLTNVDKLKRDDKLVQFVRKFLRSDKPVAALSSAPALLALADEVMGRQMTSSLATRPALERAGALWVDEDVVVDEKLLTGRGPKSLKKFNKKLVGHFGRE